MSDGRHELVAAVLPWTSAGAAVLAPVLALLLLATWRRLRAERRRRTRLAFLYEATHALSLAADLETGLVDVLGRCRSALRVGHAEVILLAPGRGAPRRARIASDGSRTTETLDPEAAWALQELAAVDGEAVRILEPASTSMGLYAYLADSGLRGPVMLAVLRADTGPLGLVLIGERAFDDLPFTRSDSALLGNLAVDVAAWLAHDSLAQDFGRLEQLQSQLEHLAFHDPLTGLPNRSRFRECVSAALARRGSLVAALFIDLDDFKTVNDSMGHRAGDELLSAVAERLRACLLGGYTPARLGGDEFAVLVEGAESMDAVLDVAGRVLEALVDPFIISDREVRVPASIGVASSLEGVRRADDLLRNADLAMYQAKAQGKGGVQLYEAHMHATAVERHTLKSELQDAVVDDQLVVLYQPEVDLRTGRISGAEALVRWQHPRLGLVAPDAFIGLAEEAGLISDIGRAVLAAACERLALWRRASIAGDAFGLSLNLSVREFRDPALATTLTDAATRAGVPTGAITLEVTESALMEDVEASITRMQELRGLGFRIGLDDFGAGYSSLGRLRSFPIDVLKVAKPFVDHIADRPEDAAFLGSVLDLARTLSLDVVVEGVETAAQARILLDLGVTRVQGFVFSRPVEDRALSALLTIAPLRGFAPARSDAGGLGAADAIPA